MDKFIVLRFDFVQSWLEVQLELLLLLNPIVFKKFSDLLDELSYFFRVLHNLFWMVTEHNPKHCHANQSLLFQIGDFPHETFKDRNRLNFTLLNDEVNKGIIYAFTDSVQLNVMQVECADVSWCHKFRFAVVKTSQKLARVFDKVLFIDTS